MTHPTIIKTNIAQRLEALLQTVLTDNNLIPAMYHKVIMNMVKSYLVKADESELVKHIKQLRDDVIPFLLGEHNDD